MIEVPDGQLYLVRPLSPKGYSELIYKDAGISIRRSSTEHNYQLIVTRVFEEGEQELLEEDDGGLEGDTPQNQDEQAFLLDEALEFRVTIRDTGCQSGWLQPRDSSPAGGHSARHSTTCRPRGQWCGSFCGSAEHTSCTAWLRSSTILRPGRAGSCHAS